MKYTCTKCGNDGSFKWHQDKVKVKCPVCQHKVFESIEDELNLLSFLTVFVAAIGSIILWHGIGLGEWLSYVVMYATCIAISSYIEYILHQRANKKALISETKREE